MTILKDKTMKGDAKLVGLVVLGVIATGFIFKNFSDVGVIEDSAKGFQGWL